MLEVLLEELVVLEVVESEDDEEESDVAGVAAALDMLELDPPDFELSVL